MFNLCEKSKSSMALTIFIVLLAALLPACHEMEDYDNTALDNFDCLWKSVDQNYCFFAEKDVDWQEVGQRYRSRIIPGITREELFSLCAEMLEELKDGHVNLNAPFNTSYYRGWWSAYPQDFDWRVVQQYYLAFDYRNIGSIAYKILPQNVGYMRYPSFSSMPGEGNLDHIFSYLSACDGLIIDIRDNGGGLLTNIEPLVGRLIHHTTRAGYIRHKSGPAHDQWSDFYPIEYKPAKENRIVWNKPLVILTNRSCFSAANTFVMVCKELENVYIVGSRTGGGGGLPFTAQMPNGWNVRFSASPVFDLDFNSIESGIDPSPGCEAHALPQELALGKDGILDKAIAILTQGQ